MRQLLLDIQPAAILGFTNFIVGANTEAVARLRGLAAAQDCETLYLWGQPGSGRSHLLAATAALAAASRAVTHLYGAAIAATALEEAVKPGGLVNIDDVDMLDATAQVAVFRLFNSALQAGCSLLCAGVAPPRQLALREDLRTRIGQALVFELQPLGDEDKFAALMSRARERGMRIDERLVNYLLRHSRRDLPTLLALLESLDRASLEQLRPATLPLLREAIRAGDNISPESTA